MATPPNTATDHLDHQAQPMAAQPEQCASEILDVIPLIMGAIRSHMRSRRATDLSVPQYRALFFIHHRPESSPSDAAEFLGLTLPTISKLIDALVARRLVSRQPHPSDRRRLILALTPAGRTLMEEARASAQACLADFLARRSDPERATIAQAMNILRPTFTPDHHNNHDRFSDRKSPS